nr:hypothetical protein [Tanacetum cinerariifolium]
MEGSRIKRNIKGNRTSKVGAEENERQEMNLSLLLAAHLGRNENGQSLPTHGLKQEKLPLIEPRMIRGITSKGQETPPRTTAGDKKVETDYGYDTNDCQQLKSQIKEAVKSSQVSRLVKGIKKKRAKTFDSQRKLAQGMIYLKAPPSKEGKSHFPQLRRVNSQVLLVGFLGEKSWAIGEFLLEITIGDTPLSRSKTLNFVIVRSNFPYNMLLGRTTMQKIRMTHVDMTGIPITIMVNGKSFNTKHKLNYHSHIKPIKQKRRSLDPDHSRAARKEVEERIRAGILREAAHQTWVANSVMVKKSNGGWRMCVDFTDINKACPQRLLPSARDRLKEKDDDKTSFFAGEGVYYYRKMPFGLKNTGVTYQRLVDKVFNDQIGRNLEAYVDDMILPTLTTPIHEEVLMMYLTTLKESITATLFSRREEGQVPVYFVIRVLQGAELNYPALEKLMLALVHATRRGDSNKETPTNFLIEAHPKDNIKEARRKTDTKLEETKPRCDWMLYTNGASSYNSSDAGLMLIDLEAKQPAIRKYLQRTKETLRRFRSYTTEHIRRNHNKKSNALSKLASMTFKHHTKKVLVEVLARRLIEEKGVLHVETKEEEIWMTPIHEYLLSGLLPEDSKESMKMKIKAPQYKLIRGSFYKKSFYTPWLRCIASPKIDDVDDLRQALWIHITLPRNNQKESLFSLTYGSEAIILTVKSNVAKDDIGRTKEVTKRKESREVASIEEAYYQNKLRRYHSKRSNHSTYKVGDFILLLQNNTENPQVWQGPHMIREVYEGELYKIINASDHSLIQTAKGINLQGDIGLETGIEDGVAF